MLSFNQVGELAKRYKIDAFSVQREFAQISFLEAIYSQPQSSELIFKGGTSLRLIYGAGRFSEDLDFTLLASLDKAKSLLAKALESFREHFPGAYIKDKPLGNTTPGHACLIKFAIPGLPFEATLHLDLSLRGDVFAPVENRLVQVKGYPLSPARPLICVLSKKELLAEKVRAFLNRDKVRDLYDLAFLLNDTEIDDKLIAKKMQYYQKDFTKEDMKRKLGLITVEDLQRDLTKFLPINERRETTYQNVLDLVKGGFGL